MKALNLPEPILAYFEADRLGAKAVAACFTSDGRVYDEGRTHVGTDAIEAWKTNASARYSYSAEPIEQTAQDRKVIVTSRVTGNFPGSPVNLRYTFTLKRGKIESLEIGS